MCKGYYLGLNRAPELYLNDGSETVRTFQILIHVKMGFCCLLYIGPMFSASSCVFSVLSPGHLLIFHFLCFLSSSGRYSFSCISVFFLSSTAQAKKQFTCLIHSAMMYLFLFVNCKYLKVVKKENKL